MNIFLYGSMAYDPILSLVVGRVLPLRAAILQGTSARRTLDRRHATCVDGLGTTEGVLVADASDAIANRIAHYAQTLGYLSDLREVTCAGVSAPAQVWVRRDADNEGFDDECWRRDWADTLTRAADEVMGYFGEVAAKDLAGRYGQIVMRAAAWCAARKGRRPEGLSSQDVEISSRRRPYVNFFMLEELDLRHRRFDGGWTGEVTRAAFVGGDAAILLPYDPVRDRVLVIEQFRTPPLVRGDPAPWMIEAIAGRVDPGETPAEAARREAWEEARLHVGQLHCAGRVYPTPGASTEFFHLFVGLADLPDDAATLAGVEDESEDIRSLVWSFEDLMTRVDGHDLRVEPLVTCALWLARHRHRLRAGG